MRRSLAVIFAALLAGSALAGSGDLVVDTISVATGAASAGTNSVSVGGYLDAIYLDVPTGTVTGNFNVAWVPDESTAAAVTLYTNATVTADTLIRPRMDGSAVATGAALTGDPPVRLAVDGKIRLILTSASATNLTWKAIVYYIRP